MQQTWSQARADDLCAGASAHPSTSRLFKQRMSFAGAVDDAISALTQRRA